MGTGFPYSRDLSDSMRGTNPDYRQCAGSGDSGGMDEAGNVLPASGDETSLKNELDRKTVESHIFMERDTTCRYSVRLNKEGLAQQLISEQGLLDEDGDLIAYKTFLPKWKDGDMEFVFEMDEIF